ncbi:uncharacterized protein LOC26527141 [Drosophila mojavensis]|uniref:Uncharacterized protein n=1 Tax=Drosophila mojavensis TaxID=7230 RepID=A0A0Q9XJS0_DROMO|nr:uncharacterized protein LOC26527141 [Drosophila mojavensis]KRG05134.1 uncharacterized protein Dmoj_GI25500 [Drosophila mojavensis]
MSGSDPNDGPSGSKPSKEVQTGKSVLHVRIADERPSNEAEITEEPPSPPPLMVTTGMNTDENKRGVTIVTDTDAVNSDADSVHSWPGRRRPVTNSTISMTSLRQINSESYMGSDSHIDYRSTHPPLHQPISTPYKPERLVDGSVCLPSSS